MFSLSSTRSSSRKPVRVTQMVYSSGVLPKTRRYSLATSSMSRGGSPEADQGFHCHGCCLGGSTLASSSLTMPQWSFAALPKWHAINQDLVEDGEKDWSGGQKVDTPPPLLSQYENADVEFEPSQPLFVAMDSNQLQMLGKVTCTTLFD